MAEVMGGVRLQYDLKKGDKNLGARRTHEKGTRNNVNVGK